MRYQDFPDLSVGESPIHFITLLLAWFYIKAYLIQKQSPVFFPAYNQ